MQRIVTLYVLLMLVFGILVPTSVYAEEPLVPGLTCGVANSDDASACCKSDEDVPSSDEGPGFLETVLSALPGTGFLGEIIEKKRNTQNDLNRLRREYGNKKPCVNGEVEETTDSNSGESVCRCVIKDAKDEKSEVVTKMCRQYMKIGTRTVEEIAACTTCAQSNGYWSALGCIPLNVSDLVSQFILTVGIGFGGLIAVGCITVNALRLQISRGDSSIQQKTRENITSCILGLVLILFSVFILRMADVAILGGLLGN